MKILNLKAVNFLGLERLDLNFEKQITIVTGPNAAGKSSFVDAIRWALDGTCREGRFSRKDASKIIRKGARSFKTQVELVNGQGEIITISRTKTQVTPDILGKLGLTKQSIGWLFDGYLPDRGMALLPPSDLRDLVFATHGQVTNPDLEKVGIFSPDVQESVRAGKLSVAKSKAAELRREAEKALEEKAEVEPVFIGLSGKSYRVFDIDIGEATKLLESTRAEIQLAEMRDGKIEKARDRLDSLRAQLAPFEELRALDGWGEIEECAERIQESVKLQADIAQDLSTAKALLDRRKQSTTCPIRELECPASDWLRDGDGELEARVADLEEQLSGLAETIAKNEGMIVELGVSPLTSTTLERILDAETPATLKEKIKKGESYIAELEAQECDLEAIKADESDLLQVIAKARAAQTGADEFDEARAELDRLVAQETAVKDGDVLAAAARESLTLGRQLLDFVAEIVPLELTDGFEVLWDGRPVDACSTAERLLAGIALEATFAASAGVRLLIVDRFDTFRGSMQRTAQEILSAFVIRDMLDQVIVVGTSDGGKGNRKSSELVECVWMEAGTASVCPVS